MNKKLIFTTLSLLSIIGYGYFAFAAAPVGGYAPGETLNPDCAPNDVDCIVTLPSGSSVTADNGLTATGTNVQLGGTLLHDTIIDQNGKDFVFNRITNGSRNSSIVHDGNGFVVTNIDPLSPTMENANMFSVTDDSIGLHSSNDNGSDINHSDFTLSPSEINTSIGSYIDAYSNINMDQYSIVSEVGSSPLTSGIRIKDSFTELFSRQNSGGDENRIFVDPNQGVRFEFSNLVTSTTASYTFPKTDGTANQVLTTDGAGQLSWQNAGGGSGWSLTGNTGTTAGTNFIGTTDAQDFVVKTNGNEIGRFYDTTGSSSYSVALGGGVAPSSNMFVYGPSAGIGATGAQNSNFLGVDAGNGATNANNSNFIGSNAGYGASYASHSNFIGDDVGYNGVSSYYSNFIGYRSGYESTNVWGSNFIGGYAGGNTNVWGSNFIGNGAGQNATNANNSNFFGNSAGFSATNASYSNFLGDYAGQNATNANNSNFLGDYAGQNATNASYSNFFGSDSGYYAAHAQYSNFLGSRAGYNATNANNSNFFGLTAGYGAIYASDSNFFGNRAGYASDASDSNFFGANAGYNATNAYQSNFFGLTAGYGATDASNSNFLGYYAGFGAINASNSNFIGNGAGGYATDASYSIFIGANSGLNDTVNNTLNPYDFSILLGNFTSTGGFSNSIALGSHATNTASNQFMIGSTTRPINETKIIGSLGTECTITTGTGMACTSDQTLKTNITDLTTDTLDKLLKVKTVTYNWLQNPNSPTQIGFLAQDLEQYFPELVTTDSTGKKAVYYSQITPILVEAIREMNLNITELTNTERPNTWRDALIGWLGDAANGIEELFSKKIITEEICLQDATGQTCYTRSQLNSALGNVGTQSSTPTIIPSPAAPSIDTNTGDEGSIPSDIPTETIPTDTNNDSLGSSTSDTSAPTDSDTLTE